MRIAVKALIGLGVVIVLLSTGYWIGNKNAESIAELPIAELPNCHPPFGDLAPDGNVFVVLTPDKMAVTISPLNSDKNPWEIKLTRPASDIIAISNETILVSYGTTGEVSLLNIVGDQPEQTIKVGNFAGGMCRSATSQAFISDPVSGKVYQFEPSSKSVIHAYSVKGEPTHMKWRVPDTELEVFGDNKESLGILNVTSNAQG